LEIETAQLGYYVYIAKDTVKCMDIQTLLLHFIYRKVCGTLLYL